MDSVDLSHIHESYEDIMRRVEEAKLRRQESLDRDVCLVAVSKKKSKEEIIEAYNCGIRHFGENYVNELNEKASDREILEMCPEIKWHFIGHLQTNKVNKLLVSPNLYMVQTVDSMKLADMLERGWTKTLQSYHLKVMIQVQTSGEKSKNGVAPDGIERLIDHLLAKCCVLDFTGLMTIGSAFHNLASGPNPNFQDLARYRNTLMEKFDFEYIDLSMGMSADFEHAIELGSTCIRIGSSLFGTREQKEVMNAVMNQIAQE